MKVGILKTSIGNFGKAGFYNAQEIGLAREMEKLCSEVIIYKPVSEGSERVSEALAGFEHTTLHQIPCRQKGSNAVWDCSEMDPTIDALVYFSDTQLAVPSVYSWCCSHAIPMFPYIGVVESHSTNPIKRFVMDAFFHRNISVYKKCTCFVKTPAVRKRLEDKGVSSIVAPVGLDMSILNADYAGVSVDALKEKWGYDSGDRVLLFIGRLTEEKQPLRMVDIFSKLFKRDDSYRLLMVGTGELRDAVVEAIERNGVQDRVQMIERIPNSDIWELYRLADAFVNLNQQEIFGMAILEAMYYGCKVVAWTAPGPDFIIENNVSGCIRETDEGMIEAIANQPISPEESHRRILDNFTWSNAAKTIAGKF